MEQELFERQAVARQQGDLLAFTAGILQGAAQAPVE
jgi:hypothetical protein